MWNCWILAASKKSTQEKLQWLMGNLGPWETVKEYWKGTFLSKIETLFLCNVSSNNYFSKYKALGQPKAHDLVLKKSHLKIIVWTFRNVFLVQYLISFYLVQTGIRFCLPWKGFDTILEIWHAQAENIQIFLNWKF